MCNPMLLNLGWNRTCAAMIVLAITLLPWLLLFLGLLFHIRLDKGWWRRFLLFPFLNAS
jgi:hypothetical protein